MSFNLEDLEGPIMRILTAPGVDLSTISAKGVRQKLLEDTALGLTARGLKERRTEVDAMISSIYEDISRQAQTDESKRKREEEADAGTEQEEATEEQDDQDDAAEEQDAEASEEDDVKPPTKKKKGAAKSVEEADAELARKLASQLNSRSRRGTSNAVVDSGAEDEDEDEEKPKKKRGGGARGGFAKEYILSESLSVVVGVDKLSRPQVVKRLWEYIRGHELQNPSNRREIMCDDNMRAVFGTEKVDMFRMNKVLGRHLHAQ
ncbi:SWIB/MDM2 domain-containing protein [Suillus occidentalis]|nr:SWIB/MDM2 domain-containing protein [Suillus occidentalis]